MANPTLSRSFQLGECSQRKSMPMQSIHFIGRILPEAAQVSISIDHTVKWEEASLGLKMEFKCYIENSKIDVECKVNEFKSEYLADLHRRALDICRTQVDLIAFKMGWGLTVIFESLIDPNGIIRQIFPKDDRLVSLCTAFTLDQNFYEICAKILQSPDSFMALRELISAISLPHVSLVECARAMDRLKHLVATPSSDDKRAWQQLREALQIDEAYLRYITDNSRGPRHGRPGHTQGEITTEVTRRAWVIMNRYFEYLKQGNTQLDPSRFPVLVT